MAAGLGSCFACVLLVCTLSVLKLCLALYEDQVGLFDWRQSYLGKVKFAFFDVSTHSSKRLFVGTESNVLAALNSRTGSIIWRQVLEESEGEIDTVLHRDSTLVSSSNAGKFIRSWDTSNGALLWEAIGRSGSLPISQLASPFYGWNGLQTALVETKGKELVISLAENVLRAFLLQDGTEKWSRDNSEQSTKYFNFQYYDGFLYLVGIQDDIKIVIQKLNAENGEVNAETNFPASWAMEGVSCDFIRMSSLICAESFSNSIHVISLDTESASVKTVSLGSLGVEELSSNKPTLQSLGSFSNSWDERPEFVLKLSATHQLVLSLSRDLSITLLKEYTERSLLSASVLGNKAALVSASLASDATLVLQCFDLDEQKIVSEMTQKVVLGDHRGEPEKAVVYLFNKKENDIGYRVFLTTSDHAISLIQFPGRIMWSREEALASITAVDVIELPFSPSQANFETLQEEFGAHPDGW